MNVISIRGAKEHNLKNISVDIPKNALVAFTGLSGSGKSSLIFDTIYAESFRRFVETTNLPQHFLDGYGVSRSKPNFVSLKGLPPAFGLSQKQRQVGQLSTVGTITGIVDLFRVLFATYGEAFCRHCSIPLKPTTAAAIMNDIFVKYANKAVVIIAPIAEKRKGAFAAEIEKISKQGFSRLKVNGIIYDLQDDNLNIEIDAQKLNSIEVIIDKILVKPDREARLERGIADALALGKGLIRLEIEQQTDIFNINSMCPQCGEHSPKLDPRHFSHSSLGQCGGCKGTGTASEQYIDADLFPCSSCAGSRLNCNLPQVRLGDMFFTNLIKLNLAELNLFIIKTVMPMAQNIKPMHLVSSEIARIVSKALLLKQGHQTLNRAAAALTPGDLQRLRLASILAVTLSGSLYVLDEPCQGLTSEEVMGVVALLRELVASGSSCVVVEHHPAFLQYCDFVFTMGPGAAHLGGEIISIEEQKIAGKIVFEKIDHSILSNTTTIENAIAIEKIALRGIAHKKLLIEQGGVTLFRGMSGCGKMSVLMHCIKPALEAVKTKKNMGNLQYCNFIAGKNTQVLNIMETKPGAITRTSRRVVAAALDILPLMRSIFCELPDAKIAGYTSMHFSWNSVLGQCYNCLGKGYTQIKQKYGASIELTCEQCNGTRFGSHVLSHKFKGYNIIELLSMSIEDSLEIFKNVRQIEQRLSAALRFGLGYLNLNQGLDELSGGELQRLLLTLELRKADLLGQWFLLVHPSTGLHDPDVALLGEVIKEMTAKGASFVLVENREEFLKFATCVYDW